MEKIPLENDILDIAADFQTDGTPLSFEKWGNGLINDTYRITTTSGNKYILQRINTSVFRDPQLLQTNLGIITSHIRNRLASEGCADIDRRVLSPVATRSGADFITRDGKVWRMTAYIGGSHTVENISPAMARLAGEAFGRFHSYFSGNDTPAIGETIPHFHDIRFRLRQLRDACAADTAGRLIWVSDLADAIFEREEEMTLHERLFEQGALPKRTVHCDTKVNNILFDDEGGILCVIDLDTVMPGFVLSDFGDFIRTAANTGKEDDREIGNIGIDMEIFRNFAKGYIGAASFLTPDERRMLPYGAKLLTYMQATRFLTDYLNGDTYYKTDYPEHNLIRTRAQLRLLSEIDSLYDEMERAVAECK